MNPTINSLLASIFALVCSSASAGEISSALSVISDSKTPIILSPDAVQDAMRRTQDLDPERALTFDDRAAALASLLIAAALDQKVRGLKYYRAPRYRLTHALSMMEADTRFLKSPGQLWDAPLHERWARIWRDGMKASGLDEKDYHFGITLEPSDWKRAIPDYSHPATLREVLDFQTEHDGYSLWARSHYSAQIRESFERIRQDRENSRAERREFLQPYRLEFGNLWLEIPDEDSDETLRQKYLWLWKETLFRRRYVSVIPHGLPGLKASTAYQRFVLESHPWREKVPAPPSHYKDHEHGPKCHHAEKYISGPVIEKIYQRHFLHPAFIEHPWMEPVKLEADSPPKSFEELRDTVQRGLDRELFRQARTKSLAAFLMGDSEESDHPTPGYVERTLQTAQKLVRRSKIAMMRFEEGPEQTPEIDRTVSRLEALSFAPVTREKFEAAASEVKAALGEAHSEILEVEGEYSSLFSLGKMLENKSAMDRMLFAIQFRRERKGISGLKPLPGGEFRQFKTREGVRYAYLVLEESPPEKHSILPGDPRIDRQLLLKAASERMLREGQFSRLSRLLRESHFYALDPSLVDFLQVTGVNTSNPEAVKAVLLKSFKAKLEKLAEATSYDLAWYQMIDLIARSKAQPDPWN